jgi:hypothetical protein
MIGVRTTLTAVAAVKKKREGRTKRTSEKRKSKRNRDF